MTAPARKRIKIRRLPAGTWGVDCDCSDPFAMFSPLPAPWAAGKTWDIALALAAWHAELHAERDCKCCGRGDALPPIKVLEGGLGLLRFEDAVYAIVGGKVRHVRADVA